MPKLSMNPGARGHSAQVPMSILRENPNRNSFSIVGLKVWLQNVAISWSHTFSPTMLNEFRFGFSRNMDIGTCAECPRAPGFIESFGIKNFKGLSAEDEGFPVFQFAQGYFQIGDSNYRPVESNDMVEKF